MDWMFLLVAGLCEMVFVVMLHLSDGFKKVGYAMLTIIFMSASFFFLSLALQFVSYPYLSLSP